MCGIAGYKTGKKTDAKALKAMLGPLFHRGPDAQGTFFAPGIAIGMRRLKINDLETGDQPLFNEDKSVVLFYNGEIYNSPQLRQRLEAGGHRFRTHSDGEVICHLYEEMGDRLFAELDGMFAAALWSVKENKLILARDIPGEKPLYFTRLPDNGIAFASEIKSLRKFPGLDLELSVQAIWDMPTFLWVPEPATIYKHIESLMPGHMLTATSSGIRVRSFVPVSRQKPFGTATQAVQETRHVVEDAVKSRLLSDVPVGCFLSSGLDSSIVTTIAAKNLKRLDTFTIRFEDLSDPYHGKADESAYAATYAKKLGTRHHTVDVKAKTFLGLLDDFCTFGDQPFAVSSGLGILAIAKAARQSGIKVLLSGDGADEVFGGYSWYAHMGLGYAGKDDGADVSFQNFGLSLETRLNKLKTYGAQRRAWAWHYYASENEKSMLFSNEMVRGRKSSLRFFSDFKAAKKWTPEEYIKQDRGFYLPNEMLRKVDRMCMAYSVEGRAPFVAPSVLTHADRLKYAHMVKGSCLKWALRQAFADVLPAQVVKRPKHGFNVPIDHWLKGEWGFLMDETFGTGSQLYKKGLIGKHSLAAAKAMLHDKNRLNGHTLLSYIMLNRWMEDAK